MPSHNTRRFTLVGIAIGIILASIVSDDIGLVQTQNQTQKDLVRFYISIVSIVSASITVLTSIGAIRAKHAWMDIVGGTSASVTLTNIVFLTLVSQVTPTIYGKLLHV